MVDICTPRRDAVSRSMTRSRLQALVLHIAGDVGELGMLAQLVDQLVRPGRQLVGVGALQRVLILRAAHDVVDGEVLQRLHVERDALRPASAWLQPPNDIHDAVVALFQRLEIDLDAAAVEVVLVPSTPMKEERLSTSGSFRMTSASSAGAAPCARRRWSAAPR